VAERSEAVQMPAAPAVVQASGSTSGLPAPRGAGSEVELTVDASGRFVATPGAVALFDRFLTMHGEMPLAAIRARLRAEIRARLAPAAAAEAMALLDVYLRYRQQAAAMLRGTLASRDLRAAMERVRQLRRETFGPAAAEALFGGHETAGQAAAEVRKLLQDPAMPRTARDAIARHYAAVLPPARDALPAEPPVPTHLLQAEEALRRQGATAAELQTLRERLVGPEAAARLAEQDPGGRDWQQRYDALQASRQAIQADASLRPAERQRALEALLSQSFTPQERQRAALQERAEQSWRAPRP
jgi:lipase chaperone LimK